MGKKKSLLQEFKSMRRNSYMTHSHFEEIADIISGFPFPQYGKRLALRFMIELELRHENFNPEKFLRACGSFTEDEIKIIRK